MTGKSFFSLELHICQATHVTNTCTAPYTLKRSHFSYNQEFVKDDGHDMYSQYTATTFSRIMGALENWTHLFLFFSVCQRWKLYNKRDLFLQATERKKSAPITRVSTVFHAVSGSLQQALGWAQSQNKTSLTGAHTQNFTYFTLNMRTLFMTASLNEKDSRERTVFLVLSSGAVY